ncbi:MAG TPA: peptidase E [Gaiellaceae bacterium]|nr:peptidase E [Gaiellaceae bacterium]
MAGTIVAMGGGPLLDAQAKLEDELLRLAPSRRPVVCFLATAVADDPGAIVSFYEAFAPRACRPTHVQLFGMPEDPAGRVAEADVVYVHGGNTANMLALWGVHGVDEALAAAWRRGAVLGGWSAGGCCWFDAFVTDSFGPELRGYDQGLGLVSGSFCPHYDGQAERRPTYERLVAGGFPPGYAADDGAAAVFGPEGFVEAVAQREGASVWRVGPDGSEPLHTRLL